MENGHGRHLLEEGEECVGGILVTRGSWNIVMVPSRVPTAIISSTVLTAATLTIGDAVF